MSEQGYFMGQDGFVWFVGVVEDRNDPDQTGRVRVRCLGFHSDSIVELPTTDLPWAHVMHPVTDAAMHGLGNSPSFLVEGSWVIGFFRDAAEKQQPVIMGSLPGTPQSPADPNLDLTILVLPKVHKQNILVILSMVHILLMENFILLSLVTK